MRIIDGGEFDAFWKSRVGQGDDESVESAVREIIAAVRAGGDTAVRQLASRFDRSSPDRLEVPMAVAEQALADLRSCDPELVSALELAADHLVRFSARQRSQFSDFEHEMEPGLFTGQRIIPVDRAAVYVPAGRFPLFSSVLMGLIPAFCAGVEGIVLASPPLEDGLPDRKVLAAACIAAAAGKGTECRAGNGLRIFAMGGAQSIAALALGTESVPRVDLIVGPGNKYVAAAKRMLFGEVGIDFIAGPSDVLVVAAGAGSRDAADLVAADMIAQAEHDPDAKAGALVPNAEFAGLVVAALEQRLACLPAARASLDSGGFIAVYRDMEDAVRMANIIAPEHLELHAANAERWVPGLRNYGSLFVGSLSAEVLGDYSAGINHTLPTSGSARFTGGLSVGNFLKTVTTLRCAPGAGFEKARNAAEILARAEGLEGHALSAGARKNFGKGR
ncbi:MAG: histidinol dehydrogenase [Treponema sp.]|nr:histidinol dehydrogenase [Treponema sp.]